MYGVAPGMGLWRHAPAHEFVNTNIVHDQYDANAAALQDNYIWMFDGAGLLNSGPDMLLDLLMLYTPAGWLESAHRTPAGRSASPQVMISPPAALAPGSQSGRRRRCCHSGCRPAWAAPQTAASAAQHPPPAAAFGPVHPAPSACAIDSRDDCVAYSVPVCTSAGADATRGVLLLRD